MSTLENLDADPDDDRSPDAIIERLRRLTVPRPEDARSRKLFDGLFRQGPDKVPVSRPRLFGIDREARALVVTGATGAGKSTLVRKLFLTHPAFPGFGMSGGDCKILSITVPSPATHKGLGLVLLDRLGWQVPSRTTEQEIWRIVSRRLHELGYVVVHFDEAQRVLHNRSDDEIRNICDKWIELLQQPYPVVLVLSGIESLSTVILNHFQCFRRFRMLRMPPISVLDEKVIGGAIAGYCKAADIGFDHSDHLVRRLIHASGSTFGIAIEYATDAIAEALMADDETLTVDHFAEAYAAATGCYPHDNPFLVDDWDSVPLAKGPDAYGDGDDDGTAKKKKGKKS
jgi:hypothetical protein